MSVISLSVENLSVSYSGKYQANKIINSVSFELNEGEIVGILGASGGGKTTILRAIVVDTLSDMEVSGSLSIDGVTYFSNDITNLSILKNIYWLPQATASSISQLHKIKVVFKDICNSRGLDYNKCLDRLLILLNKVDLDVNILNTYPYQLSGGMLQRTLIAMGVAINPKILLLDEPTSALDEVTQNRIIDLLRNASEQGTMILVASHEKTFLDALCTRQLTLKEGILNEK